MSAPTAPALAAPTTNPFPGPKPYQVDQAAVFFGRDAQVDELTSYVLSSSAVLLHAPSGHGKSSLVEAGLRPSLAELGVEVLPTVRLGRAQAVAHDGPPENPFVRVVRETLDPAAPPAPLRELLAGDALRVLVLDQFEELFLEPALWQERGTFLEQLRDALDDDRRLRVLLALRSDYLADLLPYETALPSRLVVRYGLPSLDERGARRAVSAACRETGVALSEQDLDTLLDHLLVLEPAYPGGPRVRGQSVNLVQLQVVCRRLWAERAASGGSATSVTGTTDLAASMRLFVDGAVAEVVRDLRLDEGVLRRWLEDQLLTANGRRAVVALDEEAGGLPRRAVERLEQARLVQVEQRNRTQWVELSHDSMVAALQQSNRQWEHRHDRQYRRRVAAAGALALAVLAAFPLLRAPAFADLEAEGRTEQPGSVLLEQTASGGDSALVLEGWASLSDGEPGTALRLVEHAADGSVEQVATVERELDTDSDLVVTAAATPGSRYEVVAGDVRVDYALSLHTLPVSLELDTEALATRTQTATVSTQRAALRIPAGEHVVVRVTGDGEALEAVDVLGGRVHHVSGDGLVVEVGPTGHLAVTTAEPGQELAVRQFSGVSSVAAGASATVEVDDDVAVVDLADLAGHLPAVVTTSCDREVHVHVPDRDDEYGEAVQHDGLRSRTLLVGPVPSDERLVLVRGDGPAPTCTVGVAPVPPVTAPGSGTLAVPVTSVTTAVPLVAPRDQALLVPVPDGRSVVLRCEDGEERRAEEGERLLAYLVAGRACALVVVPYDAPDADAAVPVGGVA